MHTSKNPFEFHICRRLATNLFGTTNKLVKLAVDEACENFAPINSLWMDFRKIHLMLLPAKSIDEKRDYYFFCFPHHPRLRFILALENEVFFTLDNVQKSSYKNIVLNQILAVRTYHGFDFHFHFSQLQFIFQVSIKVILLFMQNLESSEDK